MCWGWWVIGNVQGVAEDLLRTPYWPIASTDAGLVKSQEPQQEDALMLLYWGKYMGSKN